MFCDAWREAATYIDVGHLVLFVGTVIGGLALGLGSYFAVGGHLKGWDPENLTQEQRQQYNQRLRDLGLGWTIGWERLLLYLLPFLFIWPFVSPTFCDTIRCKGSIPDIRRVINAPCLTQPSPGDRSG
jgi:hypothetical protein